MSGVGLGPAGAPPRDDLPWLRRRRLRPDAPVAAAASGRSTASSAGATSAPSAPTGTSLDLAGPSTPVVAPARPPAASSSAGTSLDLSTPSSASTPAPSSGTSLDLSSPARSSTPAAGSGTSLDLSSAGRPSAGSSGTSLDLAPAGRPGAASSGGTSLDLPGAAAPTATPTRPARPRPSAAAGDLVIGYTSDRLPPGGRVSLTDDRPTLTLDRLQSGIGVLTVRAAVSEHIGDLRLAAAYRLTTGESSVLDEARGLAVAPPGTSRYVVVAARDGGDVLRLDLRQVRRLERLVVLAFSPSGATLRWGGALLVETADGGRVDVALDREPAAGVLVALSVTQVGGELVLRAEDELVHGTFRDACVAYGFTSVTWVDPWTPLT